MKKYFVLLLMVAASSAMAANGTVNANNGSPGGTPDAPIRDSNGTLAAGSGFHAQIYAGPDDAHLQYWGAVADFFPSGSGGEGYFDDGVVTIGNLNAAGGSAVVYVRAWKGAAASWDLATVRGESNKVTLGSTGDPTASPPKTAVDLVGLNGFTMATVPEPTTIGLGAVALGSLLLRRRKK